MATQILEASFEDKNHRLPTYIEVPRPPQDLLWPREPNGMAHVLLVPQLISQTLQGQKGFHFSLGKGLVLSNQKIPSRSIE